MTLGPGAPSWPKVYLPCQRRDGEVIPMGLWDPPYSSKIWFPQEMGNPLLQLHFQPPWLPKLTFGGNFETIM